MPAGAKGKRERQYEHIKDSGRKRGMSEGRAKEMAARTVNKNRGRSGSGSGSGSRSSSGITRDELYAEAKKKGIQGRSTMSKDELAKALGR